MKPAAELYPDIVKESYFYGPSDYHPIVEAIGEIVVESTDNDYQGDSRFLLRGADGRFGLLLFGWGSCSGCDALQACSTAEDVDELARSMERGTKWFDTPADTIAYLQSKDWEGTTTYRDKETNAAFVEKCMEALS